MTKTLEEIKAWMFERSVYLHPLNFESLTMEESQEAISEAYQAGLSARPDIKAAEEWLEECSFDNEPWETHCPKPHVEPTRFNVRLDDALQALRMTERVCEFHDDVSGCYAQCPKCGAAFDNEIHFPDSDDGEQIHPCNFCPSCGARVKEASDE